MKREDSTLQLGEKGLHPTLTEVKSQRSVTVKEGRMTNWHG